MDVGIRLHAEPRSAGLSALRDRLDLQPRHATGSVAHRCAAAGCA